MDTIVFDAEPLVAYLTDEPGSDVVQGYLNKLEWGDLDAYISPVQVTEVEYICHQLGYGARAREFIETLHENGLEYAPCVDASQHATKFKHRGHSLGDAYALGTATSIGATLLVGADDDFDEDSDLYQIERFRDHPV